MTTSREVAKEIVRDCYNDPVVFCRTFFPHIFVHDVPWFHRGLLALLTGQVDFLDEYGDLGLIQDHFVWNNGDPVFDLTSNTIANGLGKYNIVLIPTGFGSTTLMGLTMPAWNILMQEAPFTGYIGPNEVDSRRQLAELKRQIADNRRVTSVYGESLTANSSTSTSPRADFFEVSTGFAAASSGVGGRVRSLSYNGSKPAINYCDDIEEREVASDPGRRRRLQGWFYNELMTEVPFVYMGSLKDKNSLPVILERDPACRVMRFSIRDNNGKALYPAVMDLKKAEDRRRSLALAGHEDSYYLEYENQIPGLSQESFIEEYDEILADFLRTLKVAALDQIQELFNALIELDAFKRLTIEGLEASLREEGLFPPPSLSWMKVLSILDLPDAWLSVPLEVRHIVEDDWRFRGRREQLPPDSPWFLWLIMAGRGFGKTKTGAEWVLQLVERGYRRIAIVAPTAADLRDVIVTGESGLLASADDRNRPIYEPTKRSVTWPNGAIATLFSAEEPERLRGPQHDAAWCDEVAAWKKPQAVWDMLMFGLRLGKHPQVLVSTTPKRIKLMRDWDKQFKNQKEDEHRIVITSGSTHDNLENLAPTVKEEILAKYEGTSLGQQEIYGRLLTEIEGALWSVADIENNRVDQHPVLTRIVVAVDPPIASDEEAAEAGIVVVGLHNKIAYVLADLSLQGKPDAWARAVVRAYEDYGAGLIVAEKNQGGEMVRHTIQSVSEFANVKLVHASKGKVARAEPVSALYEQRRCKHVGIFEELEDEMTTFIPGESESPNRMDALVWGVTELLIGHKRAGTWGRDDRRAA